MFKHWLFAFKLQEEKNINNKSKNIFYLYMYEKKNITQKESRMAKLYKYLHPDLTHYNFKYKNGLNIDTTPFNPTGSCESGGLYYSSEDILAFVGDINGYIAEVELSQDSHVYKDPDSECNKWMEVYVYRITRIDQTNGHELELSWTQIQERCSQLGLKMVPELDRFIYDGDLENLDKKIKQLVEGDSTLTDKHLREGVCVRFEQSNGIKVVKEKSFDYWIVEGRAKEDEEYVDIEESEEGE